MDKEMFEAMRAIMKDELESVNQRLDRLESVNQRLDRLESVNQRLDSLERVNQRLDSLEKKMDEGFSDLTNLINQFAKDIARTEKILREHIEQPIH